MRSYTGGWRSLINHVKITVRATQYTQNIVNVRFVYLRKYSVIAVPSAISYVSQLVISYVSQLVDMRVSTACRTI